MLKKSFVAAAILLIAAGYGFGAAKPERGIPGTIAVTNTFQQIVGADDTRLNCTIQNKGSSTMYVFFGPTASATTAASWQIAAGWSISTNTFNNVVISSAIQITGTNPDTYMAGCE